MDRHKVKQLYEKVDELLRFGSPSCIRQANSIMIENYIILTRFALDSTEPKPKPKYTIADNYPAGGLTATEPCMFCEDFEKLSDQLAEAQGEVERKEKIIEDMGEENIRRHEVICSTHAEIHKYFDNMDEPVAESTQIKNQLDATGHGK